QLRSSGLSPGQLSDQSRSRAGFAREYTRQHSFYQPPESRRMDEPGATSERARMTHSMWRSTARAKWRRGLWVGKSFLLQPVSPEVHRTSFVVGHLSSPNRTRLQAQGDLSPVFGMKFLRL